MSFVDILLGKPLATSDERAEQIGPAAGIPIFGLDALSSAAYGPEAALTLLIPLGAAGVAYIVPVSVSIIVLLAIVYFSYRQTIAAYPGGGGSYTVASENLGTYPGLLAAAALMIDYVLTAAVGISAGVGALVSAVPQLQPHTLALCLGILVIVTIVNLRGVREAGVFFMIPTYAFLGSLLCAILIGVTKTVFAAGHPVPVVAPPASVAGPVTVAVSMWLLLQVFSNGCTAMTGVEAVSNGVRAFREPTVRNAQRTLTVIIGLLAILLAGIAYLVRAYGIQATDPGQARLPERDFDAGRGGSGPGLVLLLHDRFRAGDPVAFREHRVCRFSAPVQGRRARRISAALVRLSRAPARLFAGNLRAGGARGDFADSVSRRDRPPDSAVRDWRVSGVHAFAGGNGGALAPEPGPRRGRSMLVNGLGAVATGVTLVVVLVAKFTSGAWVSVLLIAGMMSTMMWVRRHYDQVAKEVRFPGPLQIEYLGPPIVIVPIQSWSSISQRAMQFALTLSPEIHALHVGTEEETNALQDNWNRLIAEPVARGRRHAADSGESGVAVPADHQTDPGLRAGHGGEKPGPANRGDRAGTGRAALVSLPAAQPARGIAEGASLL